jgi:hypothetical protein
LISKAFCAHADDLEALAHVLEKSARVMLTDALKRYGKRVALSREEDLK